MVLLLMVGGLGAGMLGGCASESITDVISTSTFNLTATSGSVVHTQKITLIVNNF
jgi:hypothetical protein